MNITEFIDTWKEALASDITPGKREILQRFFKTGPGQYGEGDIFLGNTVPAIRKVSRLMSDAPLEAVEAMLSSPIHDHRLSALLVLVERYRRNRKDPSARREIIDFYLSHTSGINNWDLVDLSAPYILGEELRAGRHHDTIRHMAQDGNLWKRRASVVSTLRPIMRDRDIVLALEICRHLVADPHPLMRKAVGWVLREVGKKEIDAMKTFLSTHISLLSATTLSYAIERLPAEERAIWRQQRKESQR